MAAIPLTPVALPPTWAEVLDRVQQAVARAEAETAARVRGLEGTPADPARQEWQPCLDRLAERLSGLEACARRAEQEAAGTEAALEETAAELRGWLGAARSAAQKLANGAPG